MPVIGSLTPLRPAIHGPSACVHQGLSKRLCRGRNVAIAYRWAEGQGAFADIGGRFWCTTVAVITGEQISLGIGRKAMTTTIPIVFNIRRPSGGGLVASLNRPVRNITGATTLSAELGPKRLELLHR